MSDGAGQHQVEQHATDGARERAAVERALADLRRGAGVVLRDARLGSAVLVVAAEVAEAAQPVIACAGTAPCCVMPQARAAALALALPPANSGTVAIPCCGGGLDLDTGLSDAGRFGAQHDLLAVETAWIEHYVAHGDDEAVALVTHAPVPLEGAEQSEIYAFRPRDGGKEHLAIVIGKPNPDDPVLLRLHSECFTGDLLGSLRCDCGEQLRGAIQEIAANGSGVLLYLAQEGRGIGLVNKLRAYRLQDEGFDTIDANERLGFAADARAYRPAATMLRALGVSRVRLLTNNPAKVEGLAACGIDVVERVPHAFPANGHNDRYLSTKAARAGHLL
jgi:GTP cyclohydrolase II